MGRDETATGVRRDVVEEIGRRCRDTGRAPQMRDAAPHVDIDYFHPVGAAVCGVQDMGQTITRSIAAHAQPAAAPARQAIDTDIGLPIMDDSAANAVHGGKAGQVVLCCLADDDPVGADQVGQIFGIIETA
jgi:hypothetical protein